MRKKCDHRFMQIQFWKEGDMFCGKVVCFICRRPLSEKVTSPAFSSLIFDMPDRNIGIPERSKTGFFRKFPIQKSLLWSLFFASLIIFGLYMWEIFPKFCEKISLLY